jgi:hypothetical protein
MQHAGPFNPPFGAGKFGLKSISYNFEIPRLVQDAIRRGDGGERRRDCEAARAVSAGTKSQERN